MKNYLISLGLIIFSASLQAQENQDSIFAHFDSLEIIAHPIQSHFRYTNNKLVISRASLELAATFDDPSRVLIRHVGISSANDQANGIIYRGLPSDLIKWSINGAEIVNPNHLSNAGTYSDVSSISAGGVLAIPFDVISKFSFNGSPASANLPTSLSGISDIEFNGVSENFLKLGLLGMEAGFQSHGKIKLKGHARYSTVGLLSDLGINFDGESIKFQDLFLQAQLNDNLNLISIIGFSENHHSPIDDPMLAMTQKDLENVDYESLISIQGVNYKTQSMEHSLFFSYKKDERNSDFILLHPGLEKANMFFEDMKLSYYGVIKKNFKLSNMAFGLNTTWNKSDYIYLDYSFLIANIEYNKGYILAKPFLNFTKILNSKSWDISYQLSMAAQYDNLNNELSFEPLFNFQMIRHNHILQLNAGMASQMQDPRIYGLRDYGTYVNLQLHRGKSANFSLSYKYVEGEQDLIFMVRSFYHHLYSIPSDGILTPTINGIDQFHPAQFNDSTSALSYGIELMIDKEFSNGYYMNINATYFDAKDKGDSKNSINLRNNYQFIYNISASRQWDLKSGKAFLLSMGGHYRGGIFETELFEDRSYQQTKLGNYLRVDMRASYKWKKNALVLDVQNITNRENDAYNYKDYWLDEKVLKKQLGIIPILSYRRTFN